MTPLMRPNRRSARSTAPLSSSSFSTSACSTITHSPNSSILLAFTSPTPPAPLLDTNTTFPSLFLHKYSATSTPIPPVPPVIKYTPPFLSTESALRLSRLTASYLLTYLLLPLYATSCSSSPLFISSINCFTTIASGLPILTFPTSMLLHFTVSHSWLITL